MRSSARRRFSRDWRQTGVEAAVPHGAVESQAVRRIGARRHERHAPRRPPERRTRVCGHPAQHPGARRPRDDRGAESDDWLRSDDLSRRRRKSRGHPMSAKRAGAETADPLPMLAVYADESCLGNGREGSNPGGAAGVIEYVHAETGNLTRWDYWVSEPATTNNRMALRSVIEAFRA